jgi:hypothetical protein
MKPLGSTPLPSVAMPARNGVPAELSFLADPNRMRPEGDVAGDSTEPDFDLGSAFDVPAFLRRQEG